MLGRISELVGRLGPSTLSLRQRLRVLHSPGQVCSARVLIAVWPRGRSVRDREEPVRRGRNVKNPSPSSRARPDVSGSDQDGD